MGELTLDTKILLRVLWRNLPFAQCSDLSKSTKMFQNICSLVKIKKEDNTISFLLIF